MTSNEKRLDKLRKLLALATKNPNEAEAAAAIDMLRERATAYGLTLDDIKNASEATTEFRQSEDMFSAERGWAWCDRFLWEAMAVFTCTKAGFAVDGDGDKVIRFYGHEVDVELAVWLRNTIKAAMAFEWSIYRDFVWSETPKRTRPGLSTAIFSFHKEMAARLKERMEQAVRTSEADPAGTALVVQKNALVEQKAALAGFVGAKWGTGKARAFDERAGAAGRQAGGRVDLGRSVGTGGVRMIGR